MHNLCTSLSLLCHHNLQDTYVQLQRDSIGAQLILFIIFNVTQDLTFHIPFKIICYNLNHIIKSSKNKSNIFARSKKIDVHNNLYTNLDFVRMQHYKKNTFKGLFIISAIIISQHDKLEIFVCRCPRPHNLS